MAEKVQSLIRPDALKKDEALAEAQLLVARSDGFESWADLVERSEQ